jgi:hypothetical protein
MLGHMMNSIEPKWWRIELNAKTCTVQGSFFSSNSSQKEMTLCKYIMQDNQPLHTHTVIGIHQSRNTTKNSLMYNYEIAEKNPQQHLEGQPSVSSSKPNYNRTSIHESSHNLMSCHSQSVGPSPLSWTTVMSCHDFRLTFSSAPNGGCREAYVIFPILWLNNYRNICVLSLCCISRSKTQSWCWLALLDTQIFIYSKFF